MIEPLQIGSGRRATPGVDRAKAAQVDPSTWSAYVLDQEPIRISNEDFRCALMSAVMSGASDVTVQSDAQPRGEINGDQYRLTRRPWTTTDVDEVLIEVFGGANGRTEINSGNALDFSYELNLANGNVQRFRVNAIGINARDGQGIEITFRALPRDTPTPEQVGLDADMLAAMSPKDGIVVIAGATGSGKSTTMAAVTRHHLEDVQHPKKIADIQAPIEFTFRDVTSKLHGSASLIGQSEVGKHIKSFSMGVHACLRRKPNIINVGEARDYDTISAALELALTGHLIYTTTHAGTVSDTVRRLLVIFPGSEREAKGYDLISSLRFVVVQHLVKTADGKGRVPVREYLRFTDRVRERLLVAPISAWPGIVDAEINDDTIARGPEDLRQPLAVEADRLFAAGRISRLTQLTLKRQVLRARNEGGEL